jgi:pyrroline-5-carboxylate reductase
VIYFPNINGSVVTANVTKTDLQNILGNLSVSDVIPSSKSVAGSIGIQPNKYISYDDDKDVSSLVDKIQKSRLMDIVHNSDGVTPAECRNET